MKADNRRYCYDRIFGHAHCLAIYGTILFFMGCYSAHKHKRESMRKLASEESGHYCQWINGEKYRDIDVELTLSLAKHCHPDVPPGVTSYQSAKKEVGVLFCCRWKNFSPKDSETLNSKSSGENATDLKSLPSDSKTSGRANSARVRPITETKDSRDISPADASKIENSDQKEKKQENRENSEPPPSSEEERSTAKPSGQKDTRVESPRSMESGPKNSSILPQEQSRSERPVQN